VFLHKYIRKKEKGVNMVKCKALTKDGHTQCRNSVASHSEYCRLHQRLHQKKSKSRKESSPKRETFVEEREAIRKEMETIKKERETFLEEALKVKEAAFKEKRESSPKRESSSKPSPKREPSPKKSKSPKRSHKRSSEKSFDFVGKDRTYHRHMKEILKGASCLEKNYTLKDKRAHDYNPHTGMIKYRLFSENSRRSEWLHVGVLTKRIQKRWDMMCKLGMMYWHCTIACSIIFPTYTSSTDGTKKQSKDTLLCIVQSKYKTLMNVLHEESLFDEKLTLVGDSITAILKFLVEQKIDYGTFDLESIAYSTDTEIPMIRLLFQFGKMKPLNAVPLLYQLIHDSNQNKSFLKEHFLPKWCEVLSIKDSSIEHITQLYKSQ